MMYEYQCKDCGCIDVAFRPVANMYDPKNCDCGGSMDKILSTPKIIIAGSPMPSCAGKTGKENQMDCLKKLENDGKLSVKEKKQYAKFMKDTA